MRLVRRNCISPAALLCFLLLQYVRPREGLMVAPPLAHYPIDSSCLAHLGYLSTSLGLLCLLSSFTILRFSSQPNTINSREGLAVHCCSLFKHTTFCWLSKGAFPPTLLLLLLRVKLFRESYKLLLEVSTDTRTPRHVWSPISAYQATFSYGCHNPPARGQKNLSLL